MSLDFHYNKRVCDEVSLMPSKRIRNKVAGYATRLMRRIQKGPVRGISLKLQEEEREKRMEREYLIILSLPSFRLWGY